LSGDEIEFPDQPIFRHGTETAYNLAHVGLDEEQIRKYVKYQERKDRDSEQGELGIG
jgi:hypothetical protein